MPKTTLRSISQSSKGPKKDGPKPYQRASLSSNAASPPTSIDEKTTSGPPSGVHVQKGLTPSHGNVKKGEYKYDKRLLVSLVIKGATNVNWDKLSSEIGKTTTHCKDVWRKVVYPALIGNRPWCSAGPGWTEEMKRQMLVAVIAASKPDWEVMTTVFEGKTKNQIHDIWRKVILPRLKTGMTIE